MTTPKIDIPRYCRIHAKRMDTEGFTKTALVLQWAAYEIDSLNEELRTHQAKT
jgi:hypothetical protein